MKKIFSHVQTSVRKDWVALLLGLFMLGVGLGQAQAALLDGLFSDLEEGWAEDAAEKGETLTIGDFYQAEVPDAHGPIGTMANHTHNFGEFMFSYRYMNMFMKGTLVGTEGVSDQDVVRPTQAGGLGFRVTPTDMTPTNTCRLWALISWQVIQRSTAFNRSTSR